MTMVPLVYAKNTHTQQSHTHSSMHTRDSLGYLQTPLELIEGIHLDLDTWIVPGQIRKANLCRGLGNIHTSRYRGVDLSRSSQHPTAYQS